jgi:hypothetical protein
MSFSLLLQKLMLALQAAHIIFCLPQPHQITHTIISMHSIISCNKGMVKIKDSEIHSFLDAGLMEEMEENMVQIMYRPHHRCRLQNVHR